MDNIIGLSEDQVNVLIGKANLGIQSVVNGLQSEIQSIINAMADNWGTADGVTYVEGTFIPEMNKTVNSIALALYDIPKILRDTAIKQAEDTNNTMTLDSASLPIPATALENKMQDKLNNGFVGIYTELQEKVNSAATAAKENFDTDLDSLKEEVSTYAGYSFKDEAVGSIVNAISTRISEMKTELDTAIDGIIEAINTSTSNVDSFERSIQSAGLRSVSSN